MDKDIQFQIECLATELVEMLMQKYGWDIKTALDQLYFSETYKRLCNKVIVNACVHNLFSNPPSITTSSPLLEATEWLHSVLIDSPCEHPYEA